MSTTDPKPFTAAPLTFSDEITDLVSAAREFQRLDLHFAQDRAVIPGGQVHPLSAELVQRIGDAILRRCEVLQERQAFEEALERVNYHRALDEATPPPPPAPAVDPSSISLEEVLLHRLGAMAVDLTPLLHALPSARAHELFDAELGAPVFGEMREVVERHLAKLEPLLGPVGEESSDAFKLRLLERAQRFREALHAEVLKTMPPCPDCGQATGAEPTGAEVIELFNIRPFKTPEDAS